MGVGKFHKWLFKTYPDCFDANKISFYDNVYIDINCILHRLAFGFLNENILFKRFYSYVNRLIEINNPTKKLIFATDGVAPLAKIILQRKRRLKISRNMNSDTPNTINPLYFTPGTKFMKSLPEKISGYMKRIETDYNIKVEFLSGAGESEAKLIRYLSNIKNNDESHLLVSTDADIIIMACSISNDNVKNVTINNLKYMISIDKLLQCHKQKVGTSLCSCKDFMMISLLMGNDYLPKLKFVEPDKLWDIYQCSLNADKKGCFVDDNLNYNFLLSMLRKLVTKLPKRWLSQFHIDNYNPQMYQNYIDGLKWCSDIYVNCICEQTEYMYNFNESPHPFGLLFFIETNIKSLTNDKISNTKLNTIADDIYAILVLPKSSLHLIDEKYSKKIDKKLDFLYDEEMCEQCTNYHKIIGNYHKQHSELLETIKSSETIELSETLKTIKKNINDTLLNMTKHKQIHKDIGIKEINFVIKYFS